MKINFSSGAMIVFLLSPNIAPEKQNVPVCSFRTVQSNHCNCKAKVTHREREKENICPGLRLRHEENDPCAEITACVKLLQEMCGVVAPLEETGEVC